MSLDDVPSFDELVDLLRRRLGIADTLHSSELHSFKKLMEDHAAVIAEWQRHGAAGPPRLAVLAPEQEAEHAVADRGTRGREAGVP